MKTFFYLTLTTVCSTVLATQVFALQALSDDKLAQVIGQSRGLSITSKQNTDIASVTYTDTDGVNHGQAGTLSLKQVEIRNTQPIKMDMEIKDYNGKKAIWLTAHSLATSMQIHNISINNRSIGGLGQSAIRMGTGDKAVIRLYTGGQTGNGLSLDMILPTSLNFDTYYTDDGTTLTQTLVFKDPNNSNPTFALENLHIDLANSGMRLSLPEISNGYVGIHNMSIGNSVFGSSILSKINLQKGAYLMIKNAKNQNEKGMEIDAKIKQNSSFEMASITGKMTHSTPAPNSYKTTAKVKLLQDLDITGMRMNVDGQRGLVLDFAGNNGTGGIQGKIQIDSIHLSKASQTNLSNQPSLGRAVLNLNLGSKSYVQIEGH